MATDQKAIAEVAKESPIKKRGITEAQWYTLTNSLYPGARLASVILVWDYCQARGLDPLKKPCHIVPMEVMDAATGKYEWRDVIMPGIYELRTTAQRTGEYLGHSTPEYGPEIEFKGIKAPQWCAMTFYRVHPNDEKQRIEFPVRVYFLEVVATKKGGEPNARWSRAPIQMINKCCEAAGLREAFPDEIGGEHAEEELDGQRAITQDISPFAEPQRLSESQPPINGEPTAPEPKPQEPIVNERTINAEELRLLKGIGVERRRLTDAEFADFFQNHFSCEPAQLPKGQLDSALNAVLCRGRLR